MYIIISRPTSKSSGSRLGLCVQSAGAYTHAYIIIDVIVVIGVVVVVVGAVGVAVIVIYSSWLQRCAGSLASPPVSGSLYGGERGTPAAHAASSWTSHELLAHRSR